MEQKKIRYAVVGLGHIAQVAVIPAFRNGKKSELAALVSGESQKLKALGKKHGIRNLYSYDQYDELLESGLVDAVYLALPNHLHKEYTVRAAKAGVHVLCEKPMAVTTSECQEMIQACERNQVKLMVAYRLHFEETHLTAIDLIHKQRKLGNLRMFQSIHSQATEFPNIRTYPISMGGGPTYDMGIYDINAARYLFRDEPISAFAEAANSGKRPFREIEETMSVILRFPGERLASIIYSFGTVATDTLRVAGTLGELSIDPAYTYLGDKTLSYSIEGRSKQLKFKARDHFGPELDYFSDCILRNRKVEPSGTEGLADIQVIEAIHESARTGRIIDLKRSARIIKLQRPGISQEIHRPAIAYPEPIHAQAPSRKKAA